MNVAHIGETGSQAADALTQTEKSIQPLASEVMNQLSVTLDAIGRFRETEQVRLDRWEAESLTVAEQSLKRAWIAFSQLHADLLDPSRGASTH
jgi:hypothetical protein